MFNLEQAVLAWRKEMIRAGIKAPVPLDELESHLRDEIEAGLTNGLTEKNAFINGVTKIGHVHSLKTEFKRAAGFFWWLGATRQLRIYRTMAILWGVFSFASMTILTVGLIGFAFSKHPRLSADFFLVPLLLYLYYRIFKSSCRLLIGHSHERLLLWRVSMLLSALGLFAMFFQKVNVPGIAFLMFCAASIWFLRPRKNAITAN